MIAATERWAPSRLARHLSRIHPKEGVGVTRALPRGQVASALCCLGPRERSELLGAMTPSDLRALWSDARLSQRRGMMRGLEEPLRRRLVRSLRGPEADALLWQA